MGTLVLTLNKSKWQQTAAVAATAATATVFILWSPTTANSASLSPACVQALLPHAHARTRRSHTSGRRRLLLAGWLVGGDRRCGRPPGSVVGAVSVVTRHNRVT